MRRGESKGSLWEAALSRGAPNPPVPVGHISLYINSSLSSSIFPLKAQVHNFISPTLAVSVSPRYFWELVAQPRAAFVWGEVTLLFS